MKKNRYSRQMDLPEIGKEGQARLLDSSVLVIGVGGLGSPVVQYLAAAGVGRIGIIDGDRVDITNLQRQVLYSMEDIGNYKVDVSADWISKINPDVQVDKYNFVFSPKNAKEIIDSYDFIIDATDNFESKFFINDICVAFSKPFSHAGINKFYGQTMTVIPGVTCCYRCIFESIPEVNEKVVGPIGALPGIVGSIQALEAIKYICKAGKLLLNRLLIVDSLSMGFRIIELGRSDNCVICNQGDKNEIL